MTFNRTQIITIVVTLLAFSILYFGCDTKSNDIEKASLSRALNMESTSIQNIIIEAKKSLSREETTIIEALNVELDKQKSDDARIKVEEQLSSMWYELNHPIIAGHYAELIAQKLQTENSWSIAGTSYLLGLKATDIKKQRDYAGTKAIAAFENALSINPNNITHKINKSLVYVENPVESPMEGILMLRKLAEDNPENVAVMNQLARLAIRTGQYDKAIERLSKAISIEPNNKTSNCLLAEAYQAKSDINNAEKYAAICAQE